MALTMQGSTVIERWPDESREAAQLVIDAHGEPDEATDTFLVWHDVAPWKRIVASRDFDRHEFPAPHIDSVASVSTTASHPRSSTRSAPSTGAWWSSGRWVKCRPDATTSRRTTSPSA